MPGVVPPVSGATVLPLNLCAALSKRLHYPTLADDFPDGSSAREILVTNYRRWWQQSLRLAAADIVALRDFFGARGGKREPFWYYDLYEGSPIGANYDGSGVNLTGRYAVRFESEWQQRLLLGLDETAFEVVELAELVGEGEFLWFDHAKRSGHIVTVGL